MQEMVIEAIPFSAFIVIEVVDTSNNVSSLQVVENRIENKTRKVSRLLKCVFI